jgi:hypothetical protein
MTTYQITSKSGTDHGLHRGATPADALAALHRDAGYPDVRAEGGAIVWPDDETRDLCGDLDAWTIREAE